jgi:toxin ParE1/3/4
MGFKLSRKAEEDLTDLYVASVEAFGQAQAERYYAEFEATFAMLAQFPRLARERLEIDPSVRVHPHKAHVIVYVIEHRDVLILRIRHGHEDWAEEG